VIARAVREQGMLTVGVVTKPFHFEGERRMRIAERGIEELQNYVDTLIIIPNQNLFRVANERTTFAQAFTMADDVLHSGVRGVTDLIVMPGLINRDFADIKTVMSEMGKAMMGTGEMAGEGRALKAAEAAISNPLLEDVSMKGARAVLINVTGGPDLMLFEVDEAVNRIRAEVDSDANILFGSALSEDMEGKVRVSVVATGIEAESARKRVDNVQKFPARRKASDGLTPVSDLPTSSSLLNVSGYSAETMSYEEELPAEEPLAEEPLVLGGADAPVVVAERTRPMMEELPNHIDYQKPRRLFGLFGGRKRSETMAAPVEPRLDMMRSNPAKEVGRQEQQSSGFALQTPSASEDNTSRTEQRTAPKARAGDLFANPDENFEIPAFLRRQKTGS
jgi:cell division protein FtsZ